MNQLCAALIGVAAGIGLCCSLLCCPWSTIKCVQKCLFLPFSLCQSAPNPRQAYLELNNNTNNINDGTQLTDERIK